MNPVSALHAPFAAPLLASVLGVLLGALPAAPAPDAPAADWRLPNFAARLELTVVNPSSTVVETLAVVAVPAAARLAPRFPGTLLIATQPASTAASGSSGTSGAAGSPLVVLPSQVDDLDGDGAADEVLFPVALGPGEARQVHLYYSTTLRDELPWPKRVHASHAFGYNRATAALESEAIGYRTYGGLFLDVQARHAGRPGLTNALVGYLGSGQPSPAGRDVIHLGDTLGLGGLFVRADEPGAAIARPPLNVPDYAHAPQAAEAPVYRVIAAGPLRAIIEARIDRWTLGGSGGESVAIRATYAIAAGESHVTCRFELMPRHVSRRYRVGAGIRHLPAMTRDPGPGRLALTGTESAAVGPIGLALFYDPAAAEAAAPVPTKDGGNDVVLFRDVLEPGRAVRGAYRLAAAWQGSGIADLRAHLTTLEQQARAAVRVEGLRFTPTPHPDRVEGEAR